MLWSSAVSPEPAELVALPRRAGVRSGRGGCGGRFQERGVAARGIPRGQHMRVCWTLAFLSVACSGHGHRGAGTGDAGAGPVVEGSCPHDPEGCPGTCNAQGYCEHDFGWGPEIRVPQGTYGVEYRGPEVARAWDEAPALVTFPRSYWIDKRETSAERYRRCSSCAAATRSASATARPMCSGRPTRRRASPRERHAEVARVASTPSALLIWTGCPLTGD